MKNVYLRTDSGVVYEEYETKRGLFYHNYKQFIEVYDDPEDVYYRMILRFDKGKESIYNRRYKKI